MNALGKLHGIAAKAADLDGIRHLLKLLHPGLTSEIDAADSLMALNDIRFQISTEVCAQTHIEHSDIVREMRTEISSKFSQKNHDYLGLVCPNAARTLITSHYPELELPTTEVRTEMLFSVALSKLLEYHSANYLQMRAHERRLQRIVDTLTHGLDQKDEDLA